MGTQELLHGLREERETRHEARMAEIDARGRQYMTEDHIQWGCPPNCWHDPKFKGYENAR